MNSILLEAEVLVNGEHPAHCCKSSEYFQRWSAICQAMGIEVYPAQLALIMVAGELARETSHPAHGNVVGAAKYLEVYDQINTGR